MMEEYKDFDHDDYVNYKGFDLSEIEYSDLPEMIEKIDAIHDDMNSIKDLSNRLICFYKSVDYESNKLGSEEQSILNSNVYEMFLEDGIREFGEDKGKQFIKILFGNLDESPRMQIAKAKALIISYERLFENEEIEAIHPSQFEESDLYKTLSKLSANNYIFPKLVSMHI